MMTYTAFAGFKILAQGPLESVALEVKKKTKADNQILIFSDSTGKQIDLDLSGSDKDCLERLKVYTQKTESTNTGAGRPKLGVIPREISLLPLHWEWLLNQDSSPSAILRRLIDEKASNQSKNKAKNAQDTTYKFLSALAGNLPNFEEAARYLYRKDKKKFQELIADWDKDLVKHTLKLSKEAFE